MKWSYKLLVLKLAPFTLKNEQIEAELNKLGQQGWELVNAVQIGMNAHLYLKRPN